MNQIKKQVCSLDAAKFFREKGLCNQSLFYYVLNWKGPGGNDIEDGEHIVPAWEKHLTKLKGRERGSGIEFLPAYTLVELNAFSLPGGEHKTIEKQCKFLIKQFDEVEENMILGPAYNSKIHVSYLNDRYNKFFGIYEESTEL